MWKRKVVSSRFVSVLLPVLLAVGAIGFLTGCGSGSASSSSMPPPIPPPNVPLTLLSTDTFSNSSSQHATEVEAHSFAFGSTIVGAFQVGRIFGGGGADIGFATSTDGGVSWTSGFLPGLTVFQGGGTFSAVSDPAVAYDAAHGVWIICTLPIGISDDVAVSRSVDGINWGNPILMSTSLDSDKNWIACDDTPTSPFYGNCYVEWDDPSAGGLLWMRTSSDGGLTWGIPMTSADLVSGIGGQPVVQPNGTVVVPFENFSGAQMQSFRSTDGGTSWSFTNTISSISDHLAAGNLRTSALPSAQVDAGGTIYVVWQDCRFRTGCNANDLVISQSNDGVTWTTPARIPIDATNSGVDHFIPGLGIDPATSGPVAHLGLTYYYYPVSNCTVNTCNLLVGFISSADGGATWSMPTPIAGPMNLASLPSTFAGLMVGDYTTTAFSGGKAFGVFAVAQAKSGSLFNEPMYTTTSGLTMAQSGVLSSIGERPVANAKSDHPPRAFVDQEHCYPARPPQ